MGGGQTRTGKMETKIKKRQKRSSQVQELYLSQKLGEDQTKKRSGLSEVGVHANLGADTFKSTAGLATKQSLLALRLEGTRPPSPPGYAYARRTLTQSQV